VKFLNKEGKLEYAYATSWGVSTRLIGALIMTHSDDTGLIVPPKLAPLHVVIVPIWKDEVEQKTVLAEGDKVLAELRGLGLTVKLDARDNLKPVDKFFEWECKGVPLRIEIGPKDVANASLCLVRRFVPNEDALSEQERRKAKKSFVPRAQAIESIPALLDKMQKELYERALERRNKRFKVIDSEADFAQFFQKDGGGFAWVHWAGSTADEEKISEKYETTIRCIPLADEIPENARGMGTCPFTGKPSAQRVIMAKAY
jgi:prolyl-tRNA synthetase